MNDEEIYLFDLLGFLVIRNALTASELKDLNGYIDAMPDWEPASGSRHIHTGMDRNFIARTHDNPYTGLVNYFSGQMLGWGPQFRALIGHHSIYEYIKAIVGESARLDHQYAIFQRHDNTVAGTLALHGGGTPYQTSEYYHFADGHIHSGLTVFSFALTDVPPGMGGFCCLPGSHKSNVRIPDRFKSLWPPIEQILTAPLNAGDILVFTEALTHGTLQWRSSHERRALLYKYAPGHMQWEQPSDGPHYDELTERQRSLLRPPYQASRSPLP